MSGNQKSSGNGLYVAIIVLSLAVIIGVSVVMVRWYRTVQPFAESAEDGQTATQTQTAETLPTEPPVVHALPAEVQDAQYREFVAASGVFNRVKASSFANWEGTTGYPDWAFDGNPNTTWQDGIQDDYGVGQWLLSYNADGSTSTVSSVTIYNGYQNEKYNGWRQVVVQHPLWNTGRNAAVGGWLRPLLGRYVVKYVDMYEMNSRVSECSLTFDDGTVMDFTLKDEKGAQTIEWEQPIETCYIRFTVKGVYQGTDYSDTCISDIIYQ